MLVWNCKVRVNPSPSKFGSCTGQHRGKTKVQTWIVWHCLLLRYFTSHGSGWHTLLHKGKGRLPFGTMPIHLTMSVSQRVLLRYFLKCSLQGVVGSTGHFAGGRTDLLRYEKTAVWTGGEWRTRPSQKGAFG